MFRSAILVFVGIIIFAAQSFAQTKLTNPPPFPRDFAQWKKDSEQSCTARSGATLKESSHVGVNARGQIRMIVVYTLNGRLFAYVDSPLEGMRPVGGVAYIKTKKDGWVSYDLSDESKEDEAIDRITNESGLTNRDFDRCEKKRD